MTRTDSATTGYPDTKLITYRPDPSGHYGWGNLGDAPAADETHSNLGYQFIYYTYNLEAGMKFGNYELRRNTGIGFELSEDSVVVQLLSVGISESGEDEIEALSNLMFMVSYTLDDYKSDPEQLLSRRLEKQKEKLEVLFRNVQPDNQANGQADSEEA